MIEPTFTFLCDAAIQSDGKLTAFGVGIDTLGARETPFQHPRLCLVIGFHYESGMLENATSDCRLWKQMVGI